MHRCAPGLVALAVAAATLTGGTSFAATPTDTMERASVSTTGGDPDGDSSRAWISRDGRYAVFHSKSTNLHPGDTNTRFDVYWRDLVAGETKLVSVALNGRRGNDLSTFPGVSADGRYAVFASKANNLVAGDGDGSMDVFRRDMVVGVTERVSQKPDGSEPGGSNTRPSVDASGRYVAYNSNSKKIVDGDLNNVPDIFVRDMETGRTVRASVASDGSEANGVSLRPVLSGDGTKVVFVSDATNLTPNDRARRRDVFVRDLVANTTTLVSVNTAGVAGNSTSTRPAISTDGRWVIFQSLASDLVPGDTNGKWDVFLYDLQTGKMERVSVAHDGSQLDKPSTRGVVNADGRYIAYAANDRNAVLRDRNRERDVIRRDMLTGQNDRVSEPVTGGDGGCESEPADEPSPQVRGARTISTRPAISDDGQAVLFVSGFCNLVPGDENRKDDIFVRRYGTG